MSIAKPRHHQLFQSKTFEKQKDSFYKLYGDPHDLLTLHSKFVLKWIAFLQSGTLDESKEVPLHGEFLNDWFRDMLGYRTPTQGEGQTWELEAEKTNNGGQADGALGFFSKKGKTKLEERIVAPIELKSAKTDLDRRTASHPESPVDQGWRYARNTDNCDWFIVSNYREIRLYHTSKNFTNYESFLLEDLADFNEFRRFYFLFCRQNFLPINKDSKSSKIDELFVASNQAEIQITDDLYKEYKQLRAQLFDDFSSLRLHKSKYSPDVLIEKAQKLLDRVIFICFCGYKGLIDKQKILSDAYESGKAYNNFWENFKKIFRWIDVGNDDPPIEGYNGGLFKYDPILDEVLLIDGLRCQQLARLERYDFDSEISVDILGHIFEQSISDLEELQRQVKGIKSDKKEAKNKSNQKIRGVYYTPPFITQYIVSASLDEYLDSKRLELCNENELQSSQAYLQILQNIKVIDPACGSGAFLIAAYEYLFNEYDCTNHNISILGGKALSIHEIKQSILTNNLFGVDLSPESVGITKLSLWLHTAERKQKLENLDRNIKVGNSLISDCNVSDRSFDWQKEFPTVFAGGGFDVVIGNPPYVRAEYIEKSINAYLQEHYESYSSKADLCIYFYEKGTKILKSDGVLSYIVTNKWLEAIYGKPLKRFLKKHTLFKKIIDFGDAPIFRKVSKFPCIVLFRKISLESVCEEKDSNQVLVYSIPREEKLDKINLYQYIRQKSFPIIWSRFTEDKWSLQTSEVEDLKQKIKLEGISLKDFANVKPLSGIKTGFNEAFLIPNDRKRQLIWDDPNCAEVIKPYLRGEDIKRWHPEWDYQWIILLKSSANYEWNWSESDNEEDAEKMFSQTYPSIYKYFKLFEPSLRNRSDKGRYWWELRACIYYQEFQEPKILYQEINTHPSYMMDYEGFYTNNKPFLLPTSDIYICSCLNSPIGWWIAHNSFPKMLNGSITPRSDLMIDFPIAEPTPAIRIEVEEIATRLIAITKENQQRNREVCEWIQSTHNIPKLGQKLEDFASLTQAEFVQAIRDRKPKTSGDLSPKAFKAVNEAYQEYAIPIQRDRAEANRLEHRLNDLINQAYQLTPAEIELMWRTAPPRMPISREL